MYPNVRAEMARRDMTVESMASHCGVSTSTMSQILLGKRVMSYNMAKRIKSVLGVDIPLETLFAERMAV